ncbi:hypothetical protein BLNAU_14093 [Blattamonas nauphoetae]|uniref:Fanconi-associated nuclease n=1 Tax=Blattamonas nauphoetae TaxID=2049346 RepID=A0ABQ9XHU6_9EUKA|nr:hypothetical protein BLNAU_14093 [Blattamonas nauphoetae]
MVVNILPVDLVRGIVKKKRLAHTKKIDTGTPSERVVPKTKDELVETLLSSSKQRTITSFFQPKTSPESALNMIVSDVVREMGEGLVRLAPQFARVLAVVGSLFTVTPRLDNSFDFDQMFPHDRIDPDSSTPSDDNSQLSSDTFSTFSLLSTSDTHPPRPFTSSLLIRLRRVLSGLTMKRLEIGTNSFGKWNKTTVFTSRVAFEQWEQGNELAGLLRRVGQDAEKEMKTKRSEKKESPIKKTKRSSADNEENQVQITRSHWRESDASSGPRIVLASVEAKTATELVFVEIVNGIISILESVPRQSSDWMDSNLGVSSILPLLSVEQVMSGVWPLLSELADTAIAFLDRRSCFEESVMLIEWLLFSCFVSERRTQIKLDVGRFLAISRKAPELLRRLLVDLMHLGETQTALLMCLHFESVFVSHVHPSFIHAICSATPFPPLSSSFIFTPLPQPLSQMAPSLFILSPGVFVELHNRRVELAERWQAEMQRTADEDLTEQGTSRDSKRKRTAQTKKEEPRQSSEEDACILSLLEALSNFGVPSTRIVFAGHVDHYGGELVTTGKRGKSVFVDVGGAPMSVEEIALMSYSESAGGRAREWLLKTHGKTNQLFGQLFDVLFADVLHALPISLKLDVQSLTEEKLGIDEEETEWNNDNTDEPSPAKNNTQDPSVNRWPEDQLWCLEDCNLSPIRQQPADVHINILFLKNRCDAIDTQLRRIEAALQKMNDEGSSDHSQKEETQTPHALETMETEESDQTEHVLSLREIVSRGWNRLTETRETRHIFDEDTLLNWRKMRHLASPDDLDERGHLTEATDTPEESAIPSDLDASPPKEDATIASLDDKLREARSDILGVVAESMGEFCLRLCEVISLFGDSMRCGFPDLTLCGRDPNGGKEEVVIVEVKGPRDKLSGEQIAWMNIMASCGVDIRLCRVAEE